MDQANPSLRLPPDLLLIVIQIYMDMRQDHVEQVFENPEKGDWHLSVKGDGVMPRGYTRRGARYAVMPLLLSHRTIHSITTPLLYRDIRLIGQNRTYSFVLHSCPRDLRHIRSLKSRDIYKRGKGKQVGAWKVLTRRLEQASKLTGQTGKVVDLMAVKGAFHYCFDTRGDSIMDIRTAWALGFSTIICTPHDLHYACPGREAFHPRYSLFRWNVNGLASYCCLRSGLGLPRLKFEVYQPQFSSYSRVVGTTANSCLCPWASALQTGQWDIELTLEFGLKFSDWCAPHCAPLINMISILERDSTIQINLKSVLRPHLLCGLVSKHPRIKFLPACGGECEVGPDGDEALLRSEVGGEEQWNYQISKPELWKTDDEAFREILTSITDKTTEQQLREKVREWQENHELA